MSASLITYEEKRFSAKSLAVIEAANSFIEDYREQGYTLTLRQIFYQFVARRALPNTEQSYKRLGSILTDARMAGRVPWDGIEDRTRSVNEWLIQENPREVLNGIEFNFGVDYWQRQGRYIECWVEKEALAGVVERPCQRWRVPYMACRGYLSASEAWRASRRFTTAISRGLDPIILHLGDHDPSGLDMTRDNAERMKQLVGDDVPVLRLALNIDQVKQYAPPPNPAKITDSRVATYIEKFGRESWELDALQPSVIGELVSTAVKSYIDPDAWNEAAAEETEKRGHLAKLHHHWPKVLKLIGGLAPAERPR